MVFSSEQPQQADFGPTITTAIMHQERSKADAEEDWFLLEEGGFPAALAPLFGIYRSPLWLRRNRFAENVRSSTIPSGAPYANLPVQTSALRQSFLPLSAKPKSGIPLRNVLAMARTQSSVDEGSVSVPDRQQEEAGSLAQLVNAEPLAIPSLGTADIAPSRATADARAERIAIPPQICRR